MYNAKRSPKERDIEALLERRKGLKLSLFPQPLYVAIPAFLKDMATLDEFVDLLPLVIREMENSGLPPNSSYFCGGHSLGGAVVQAFSGTYQSNYTKIYDDWKYEGQLLNAAFLTHEWRDSSMQLVVNYSIPTLTLGGELDGNCRISRIIEQYYVQLMANVTFKDMFVDNASYATLLKYPVVAIHGMSHMQYAVGQTPEAVMEHDLMPDQRHGCEETGVRVHGVLDVADPQKWQVRVRLSV